MNQILKRQTSRSHYGSKVPAVTIAVFKHSNKIGKTVVKAVPYPAKQMPKTLLRHTLIKKYFWHFSWLLYLYTFSLYENASLIIVYAETEYISTRSWYRNINFLRDRITVFICRQVGGFLRVTPISYINKLTATIYLKCCWMWC